MSDATTAGSAAAALLAGNPGGENPPTGGSTTPTSGAGGATPPPQPQGASGAAPTTPNWLEGLDAETTGFVQKKGWKDPASALKSYRELERTLSQDKVVLPKDDAKPEEWDAVFNRLGRPESPDKYTMPEGADEATFKALAPHLHKAGLTQKQLNDVAKAQTEHVQNLVAQDNDRYAKESTEAVRKLEKEWGSQTPAQIEQNRRAMRALGLTTDQADAYMRAGGTEAFMRLLNLAGRAVVEDNSGDIKSDTTLGFSMTPERAASDLAELRADKSFMERYNRREPAAREKMDRLMRVMSDGGMVKRTINTAPRRT